MSLWAPTGNMPLADALVPSGRRERKKSQTRDDLISAAVHLFATSGYDSTTVEQITELADVSPRTFFRHFSSKEDVIFPDELPTEALMAAMSRQPETSNDLRATRDAYSELLCSDGPGLHRMLQMKKAMRSTPALEGRDLALQNQFRAHLAQAVARRHGIDTPDALAELVAALAQAVLHLAFEEWVDADGSGDLIAIVRRHFDLAEQIVITPTTSNEWRRMVQGSTTAADVSDLNSLKRMADVSRHT